MNSLVILKIIINKGVADLIVTPLFWLDSLFRKLQKTGSYIMVILTFKGRYGKNYE